MSSGSPIKLGDLLVRANVVSEAQLNTALAEQKRWGGKVGEILVRMSYLPEDVLVRALSKQLGLPKADLEAVAQVPRAVLDRIPRATARSCHAVPLAIGDDGRAVVVAMADPHDLKCLDELRSVTRGARIVPYLAGRGAIERAIVRLYEREEPLAEDDGGLNMVDALGRAYRPTTPPSPVPPPPRTPAFAAIAPGASAGEAILRLEEQQGRELQVIRTLVDLLIERGLFSREEYLARVRR
jgi:hypothetical protein